MPGIILCPQGYDFSIEHRKSNLNVVPDNFSRVSADEMDDRHPVEKLLNERSAHFQSQFYLHLIYNLDGSCGSRAISYDRPITRQLLLTAASQKRYINYADIFTGP